jgi:hypothetical protein
MRWLRFLAALSCVGLFVGSLPEVRTGKKAVKLTQQWKGSVEDETLLKGAPEFIANKKALQKLWQEWKLEHKLPQIDFRKEIVILATSRGSRLNLSARLDDEGALQVLGFGTRDLRPGFRYVLATVPRDGIKTVNKKPLPGE